MQSGVAWALACGRDVAMPCTANSDWAGAWLVSEVCANHPRRVSVLGSGAELGIDITTGFLHGFEACTNW